MAVGTVRERWRDWRYWFFVRRSSTVVVVVGLVGAGLILAGAGHASVARCQRSGSEASHPGLSSSLLGVTVTSACNAWAVGYYSPDGTTEASLIEHWNGKVWTVQHSPTHGGGGDVLYGVAATSPTNAWAVGYYTADSCNTTQVERWNGKTWRAQRNPNPRQAGRCDDSFAAVAATSPTDAWAAGFSDSSGSLVEHWNGKAWRVQPSPSGNLLGLAASSPTSAWAVGWYYHDYGDRTLVEHWNGKAWKVQPSPNPDCSATS